jgi:3-phenylpropionate/trans-cinnamate dioxygenase ferredoxin component
MADWIDVAPVTDIPIGSTRTCQVDGVPVVVYNLAGRYFAIEDLCSHEASTLSDGTIEGDEVVCPLHGAHFSIRTGAALSPPAYEPVPTFPVRIANGIVQVRDERWD